MNGGLMVVCLALLGGEPVKPPITALAFAPDGKSVVVGSQVGLELRSWPGLDRTRTLPTKLLHIHDLAFSPDGKTLAAVGGTPARRGTIELYRWSEGKLLRQASPCKDLLHAICWREDSTVLAIASHDKTVRTYEASTLKELRIFEGHSRGVLAAAYLPGSERLISASLDESLRLWDAERGTLIRTLSNHTRAVLGLAVRPKSEGALPMVASISEDRTLRLWQPTIGRLVRFVRLKSVPQSVAWSHDGTMLLVSCKDGHLRVIDPDTVEVLQEVRALKGLAYSLAVASDGSVLVGGQNGELSRWMVRKNQVVPLSDGRPNK